MVNVKTHRRFRHPNVRGCFVMMTQNQNTLQKASTSLAYVAVLFVVSALCSRCLVVDGRDGSDGRP